MGSWQDPQFKPSTRNRHPHANVLRPKTPDIPGALLAVSSRHLTAAMVGWEPMALSPYAVAGCVSDAERDMEKVPLTVSP